MSMEREKKKNEYNNKKNRAQWKKSDAELKYTHITLYTAKMQT
jgi:hypothetical protein